MVVFLCCIQRLQSEHDHLVTQVDTVRDTAIEIIAHSNRYSKTVEPLLTLLNQRWQEATNRLKVSLLVLLFFFFGICAN